MPAPLVFRLRHLPTNAVVARVTRLDGFWRKGRGVLGLRSLPPGQGVWLPQVASVHTLFVTFPLDLLFLGKDFGTLAARRGVPPDSSGLGLGARTTRWNWEQGHWPGCRALLKSAIFGNYMLNNSAWCFAASSRVPKETGLCSIEHLDAPK